MKIKPKLFKELCTKLEVLFARLDEMDRALGDLQTALNTSELEKTISLKEFGESQGATYSTARRWKNENKDFPEPNKTGRYNVTDLNDWLATRNRAA